MFIYSTRRRHTRFDCDWSSDVCSSDLCVFADLLGEAAHQRALAHARLARDVDGKRPPRAQIVERVAQQGELLLATDENKIGRASCRECVWDAVVAPSSPENSASTYA